MVPLPSTSHPWVEKTQASLQVKSFVAIHFFILFFVYTFLCKKKKKIEITQAGVNWGRYHSKPDSLPTLVDLKPALQWMGDTKTC